MTPKLYSFFNTVTLSKFEMKMQVIVVDAFLYFSLLKFNLRVDFKSYNNPLSSGYNVIFTVLNDCHIQL